MTERQADKLLRSDIINNAPKAINTVISISNDVSATAKVRLDAAIFVVRSALELLAQGQSADAQNVILKFSGELEKWAKT